MIRVCAVLVLFKAYASEDFGNCDHSDNKVMKEGNAGETSIFPWLGVLRVHLHQGAKFKVALTGLVLVKKGFAIANADDVARIPKRIFKEDSKAMFIPVDGKPWFCNLLDYMTHPEYELSTMNTIALVELDPGKELYFPMKPICWPPYSYNTSNGLYAVGFIDDNRLLEKSVYSLQYVDRKLCDGFYNRAGLVEGKLTPTHYLCGFAKHNQENCVWDNGMVLASNTTGQWKLIGFGIRGPGCAAPARFISMEPFHRWIQSATDADGDQLDYRKSAFNEGFKKTSRSRQSDDSVEGVTPDFLDMIQHWYPFDTEMVPNEFFSIDRIDAAAVNIINTEIPYESQGCDQKGLVQVYKDETKVVAKGRGDVSYRLSLYDLKVLNYTCVKIWLKCISSANATLYYTARVDNMEGSSFRDFGTTPEHLLITYPILPYQPHSKEPTTTPGSAWKPGPHLKVAFLTDEEPYINIETYNIYFMFQFEEEGIINVEVYGNRNKNAHLTTSTTEDYEALATRNREEVDFDEYNDDGLGGNMNQTDAQSNTDAQGNGTVTQNNGTITQGNGTVAQDSGTVIQDNGQVTQDNGTVTHANGVFNQANGTVTQVDTTDDEGDKTLRTLAIKNDPARLRKMKSLVSAGVTMGSSLTEVILKILAVGFCARKLQ